MSESMDDWAPAPDLRTDVPHSARMYDYYLGGKDNFPADREAAEELVARFPDVPAAARANRRFLGRVVRFAAESGIRRFLDVGTGIPTADNTHEVAQAVAPDAQVVYVDNDPIVLAHARALLRGTPEGRTAYVDADFRDPERILGAPATVDLLSSGEPVALLMIALLHFFPDDQEPQRIVRTLLDALPSGSMLAVSHASGDFRTAQETDEGLAIYQRAGVNLRLRTREEVLRFFDGTELVEPGLVAGDAWRPEGEAESAPSLGYGGVGVKP